MRTVSPRTFALLALLTAGCDGSDADDAGVDAAACGAIEAFPLGDLTGHPDPLEAGPGEARAGRIAAESLPPFPSRLEVWEAGDFVLANDAVAMVIEAEGESDLYDPWGGRPVGIARVEGGALVEPGDFGEILILLGRMSVLTESVTVLADGVDGGPAIIRAEGAPRPTPFFESVTAGVLTGDFSSTRVAIDYVLEPDAEHVDVFVTIRSAQARPIRSVTTMHAFMHTPRMPPFTIAQGFTTEGDVPFLGFADEAGTSFVYRAPGEMLGGGLEISGFVSFFGRPVVAPCGETRRHHARIAIGGPGVDGALRAARHAEGEAERELTGTVRDAAGAAVAGAWIVAEDAQGFLTRGRTDEAGAFAIAVPEGAAAELYVHRPGARTVGPLAPAATLTVPTLGAVRVRALDGAGAALPARVQLLAEDAAAFEPRASWGIPEEGRARTRVVFAMDGEALIPAEPGAHRVMVSRGYEYELVDRAVTVVAGETVEIEATLTRVVDTADVMCADFHIHTHRSNDAGDDARHVVRSAVADGLEIPVRSEHEYVADFSSIITELGLAQWAYGPGSIELTSFESWGHMGVFPLTPDSDEVNAGAPRWQRYPTREDPDAPLEILGPVEVFDAVRARPEAPVVIINHPRGSPNYFDFAGYDPVTGDVARPDDWDEDFTLVEVFNDRDWLGTFDRTVRDWLSFLDRGRRVFAVGSSDSHGVARSPVGYPRTCLRVGTDDPAALDAVALRDALAAGASTISGGIYVDTSVTDAEGVVGPGGEARGLGASATVSVRVQAASWVDVDRLDVVVDGAVVQQIDISPDDADPLTPTTRLARDLTVPVAAEGSYVILAAYGDASLEPVHPGRIPFGVTNPIFLAR